MPLDAVGIGKRSRSWSGSWGSMPHNGNVSVISLRDMQRTEKGKVSAGAEKYLILCPTRSLSYCTNRATSRDPWLPAAIYLYLSDLGKSVPGCAAFVSRN